MLVIGPIIKDTITSKNSDKGTYVVFIGEFTDNKIHKGCIMYANNDTYEGEFNNCKRHGRGTYFFNSGKKPYKGDWRDGILLNSLNS